MDEHLASIAASFDRLEEAHFHIHSLEHFYHAADPFRWMLNSYLRSLKEIPQLLQMELQTKEGFKEWFKPKRKELLSDPLIAFLSKQRDLIVHRGMLVPKSSAVIGLTEGRGIKSGVGLPINPFEDSDSAMNRYLLATKKTGDLLRILEDDEESLPCVEREWRLEAFDEELLELCTRAWERLANLTRHVLGWLGADAPPRQLDCRHSAQDVRFLLYERGYLRERLAKLLA